MNLRTHGKVKQMAEDLLISSRDYQKIVAVHSNEGYKEGITAGKELRLQESFDKGFEQGINSGYEIGRYIAWKQTNPSEIGILDLEKIPLNKLQQGVGLCQICANPKAVEDKAVEEVIQANSQAFQAIQKTIADKLNSP